MSTRDKGQSQGEETGIGIRDRDGIIGGTGALLCAQKKSQALCRKLGFERERALHAQVLRSLHGFT